MTTQNQNDDFEEGLRHILSPGAALPGGQAAAAAPLAPRMAGSSTRKLQAAADKLEANQKALVKFKIIRFAAVIALIIFLAYFVYRITHIEPRRGRRSEAVIENPVTYCANHVISYDTM